MAQISGNGQPLGPSERGVSFSETNDAESQRSSVSPGLGPSGIFRIRSNGNISTRASLPRAASASDARAMTISIPQLNPAEIRANLGPLTAGLFSLPSFVPNDLYRFPSESLHSFSFTSQHDDTIHARQNVLKRSIDFMRDRSGLGISSQAGIVQARAKLEGDQETQSMLDLLSKADIVDHGPLSGPLHVSDENHFEKEFVTARTESPTRIEDPRGSEQDGPATPTRDSHVPAAVMKLDTGAVDRDQSKFSRPAALRRTYTDIGPLELSSRLTDALAQPYTSQESARLSPIAPTPSLGGGSSISPNFAPHSRARAGPTTEATFRTEADDPWTITAANDLACLTFGITKTELRKLTILDLVQEDKRQWLREKLSSNGLRPSPALSRRSSSSRVNGTPSALSSSMGSGITARLLSKPPSRENGQGRRNRTPSGQLSSASVVASPTSIDEGPKPCEHKGARGVVLCGDVLPVTKRNGAAGSASFWVQEQRSGLIWVLEEIAQDIAYLLIDEIGCVEKGYGALEGVWGLERVKPGVDTTRLIPEIPRRKDTNTGALDFDGIAATRRYTARTANDISIPVTVDLVANESLLGVYSFPNIAGMIFVSPSNLRVVSSNTAVCEALFGKSLNGCSINETIPGFGDMLKALEEQEDVELVEDVVIPEHSFRQARSLVALREGKGQAAAAFLRPSGLPAIHRDGAEIMVDVQMRIIKAESVAESQVILEEGEGEDEGIHTSQLLYAVWVTYSRTLHAVNHGIGPISPLISRPGTPPHQPTPHHAMPSVSSDESEDDAMLLKLPPPVLKPSREPKNMDSQVVIKSSSLSTMDNTDSEPHKKTIADFQILEEMGAGAYGQVKLARNRRTGSKVVIKYVIKSRILVDTWTRDRRLGTVPLEIHVLDYLRRDGYYHPNIVEMSDFFEDPMNYYIEMIPHGLPGMDLFDYIELRDNMNEAECKKIFAQVASAVEFLHLKAKVVHRDIKDENVILDGECRVKLIDFGSASYIKNGPFDVFVGTVDYASPEVLTGDSYDGPPQDIWALGVLMYTITYREIPFTNVNQITDDPLRIPWMHNEQSLALMKAMLDRDVGARPDIRAVMSDPWMSDAQVPDFGDRGRMAS